MEHFYGIFHADTITPASKHTDVDMRRCHVDMSIEPLLLNISVELFCGIFLQNISMIYFHLIYEIKMYILIIIEHFYRIFHTDTITPACKRCRRGHAPV